MRKRSVKIQLYLNEKETAALNRRAQQSGLSRSVYLRSLINGWIPRPLPPLEYQLYLNQLAELKHIVLEMRDELEYCGEKPEAEQLNEIRQILLLQMRNVSAVEGRCEK